MTHPSIAELNARLAPKREDLVAETLHLLGAQYTVDGVPLPHPVAGTLALLDAIESPFVRGADIQDKDIFAAAAILDLREAAVGPVMEATYSDDPAQHMAACWIHPVDDIDALRGLIAQYLTCSLAGFNFFPKGEKSNDPVSFGAEFLALVCRVMGEAAVDPSDAIWREPLCRVGFCMASIAKANGAKNVGRENTINWEAAWDAITSKPE